LNKKPLTLSECKWSYFIIGNLFDSYTGTDLIISTIKGNGDIPIISHKAIDNGIATYTSTIPNRKLFNYKKTISLADRGNFKAFVQKQNFYIGTRVKALEAKEKFSYYALLFIANSINKQSVKFSYGYNACDNIDKLKIMLPVNTKGEPDYRFMEDYIKEHEEKLKNQYKDYIKSNVNNFKEIKLNKEWKEFFISEIFEKIQRGKRLIKEHQEVGNIPYVSSTALNNGIDNFIGNKTGVRKYGNCLSLANSGSVGACFYEPFEYIASDHVTHLKGDYSKYSYLFMSCMLNRLSEKYNFNREINDTRIKREKIFLPVDSKGEPDYKFMEDYMKYLEQKKLLEYLDYIK